ncbi:MAG TPA: response regulator, partial [Rhodobacteraceae bacterium]|nr:response regulator [Paracoccaceae bacterium]
MSLQILAVDDSRTIRDMLNLTLNQAGFTPHLADDGIHGIEVLEEMSPPPDA